MFPSSNGAEAAGEESAASNGSLEHYARLYAQEGLAIAWTISKTGDPDAKKVTTTGWQTTTPLRDPEVAAKLFKERGRHSNPAVVLRTSGLIGIECDGPEDLARLQELGLPLTVTVQSSAPEKQHFWFRPPADAEKLPFTGFRFESGKVTGDSGRYFLVPPALHPSGVTYKFVHDLADTDIAELPEHIYHELSKLAGESDRETKEQLRVDPDAKIRTGQRRHSVFRYACQQRRWEADESEIVEAAMRWNERHCEPPLTLKQVEDQVKGAMLKDGEQELAAAGAAPAYDGPVTALDETVAVFAHWLHLPDLAPVYATLGAAAANYLPGNPVWLVLVGAPSSGKTELLLALSRLPDIHSTATLTEAGLLSGSPKREHASDAKGGLLRAIGDFGLIVMKDMGSLLSMRPDSKTETLAALREIYDGSWTRHVGTDGGRTLHWSGKVGLLAGVTPIIDRHHGVLSTMGERFTLCRLAEATDEQALTALSYIGEQETTMREELAAAVAGLFAGKRAEPRALDDEEKHELVRLAGLVARARSAVERDRYTREIEQVVGAEGPARLARTLERLLAGLDTLGCDRELAWQTIRRVALDCMPVLRRQLLEHLCDQTEPQTTKDIAKVIDLPTSVVRRALEDLTAYHLAYRAGKEGNSDLWAVSDWTRERLR